MIKKIKPLSEQVASVPLQEYAQTLLDIKHHVQNAQIKATLSANK